MIIIAAYCRVSTEGQSDRDTIDAQITLARAWITAQGHEPELYLDDGVSGMLEFHDRPEGARLLADAVAGKFARVVVYKFDRLARGDDARWVLNAVDRIQQAGAEVISLTESIDTSTPSGKFFLTVLAGLASLDRQTFLERSRLGLERVARLGKYVGGVVPYGYRKDEESYLQPAEDPIPGHTMSEAEVIRLIYRLSADEGWACLRIAEYLASLGVPPRYVIEGRKITRGKRKVATAGVWTAARIRNTITLPVYRGEIAYGRRAKREGREVITAPCIPLVDDETWYRAQATLKQNLIDCTRKAVREYLLRGLLICGRCGRRYTGTAMTSRRGEKAPYYVCGSKAVVSAGQQPCTSKNVPATVEEDIWQMVVQILTSPGARRKWLAQAVPAPAGDAQRAKEGKALSAALHANSGERERLIRAYRRGAITDEEFDAQVAEVDAARRALEERRAALDGHAEQVQSYEVSRAQVVHALDALQAALADDLTIDQRRQIVRALVASITVHTHGEGDGRWHKTYSLEVTWKAPSQR